MVLSQMWKMDNVNILVTRLGNEPLNISQRMIGFVERWHSRPFCVRFCLIIYFLFFCLWPFSTMEKVNRNKYLKVVVKPQTSLQTFLLLLLRTKLHKACSHQRHLLKAELDSRFELVDYLKAPHFLPVISPSFSKCSAFHINLFRKLDHQTDSGFSVELRQFSLLIVLCVLLF